MTQPAFVKRLLPYGYVIYRADDIETKRKVEADRETPAVSPRLGVRLEREARVLA